MYKSFESDDALADRKTIFKSYSKGVQNKLLRIIKDILEKPRNKKAIGKPEELKHTDIEKWSRELTKKDRIVYTIEPRSQYNLPNVPEVVIFHQYLGNYDNK